MDMVENVRGAIYNAIAADPDGKYPLASLKLRVGEETGFPGRCYIDGYVDLTAIARAAIEAMRQASEEMVQAGEKAGWDSDNSMPAIRATPLIYQAMITQALKEG